jgi:Protein of unknown function DUF262
MPSLERPRVEYRTPEDLVRDVQRGLVRIPQFQRNFKWEATDILSLFDSILAGYPIGNLLLWQRPAPAAKVQIGPLSVSAPALDAALWVVDGQQRITSLVGALTSAHNASDPRFRVHLDLESGKFHTAGARQQVPLSWLPASRLADTATLLRWMRENSEWLTQQQLDLADRAAKALREYQIPTYVVRSDDEQPLLEIFTRMNTTGKRLTKSEVFQALHSSATNDELASLAGVGRLPAELGFGAFDDRLVLRAVLAFLGGDVYREDFRAEFASDAEQIETMRDVAGAIGEVVRFLQVEAGIPHVKLLPYSHVVPVLVRFVKIHGTPEGRAATLLRRWVWRVAVAGTRARAVSVPDVRGQIAAANKGDSVASASAILALVPPFPDFSPELDKIHFSHAMTKINVLGLFSANPLDPETGSPVNIAQLLEHGSPLIPIVYNDSGTLAGTIANRAITLAAQGRSLRTRLTSTTGDVAMSHLITPKAQQALARGAVDEFLAERAQLTAATIRGHVNEMAEWGARNGESISGMLRSVA